MEQLQRDIRACTICIPHLPMGPRPVFAAAPHSKMAIVGQAPGRRVHESGIPWDDPSGDNLRRWLKVSREAFYRPENFALLPMGFCYPGTGKSGDLPPRKECAPQWHELLFEQMDRLQLILLVGQYAQKYYLGERRKKNLTETVRHYREYGPYYFPLPHPSPRNNIWQKKNPWFAAELIPQLAERVSRILHTAE